jgi:dipeptidyl aminopeptidase/acylaminoacyl peptidase
MLVARPFDADAYDAAGEAESIAGSVVTGPGGNAAFSVSPAGIVGYQTDSEVAGLARLTWFDRSGRPLGVIGEENAYTEIDLSPDGKRLIVGIASSSSNQGDLWMLDLSQVQGPARFTSEPGLEAFAVWSADGSRVIFGGSNPTALYERTADLLGEVRTIRTDPDRGRARPFSWSRDGRLLFALRGGLFLLSPDKAEEPTRLAFPQDVNHAQFSPDGTWIAYQSQESGTLETYIAPLPGHSGRKIKASANGGGSPRWSSDGKELFFVSNDERLMSVAVNVEGDAREVGPPTALFPIRRKALTYGWTYDVAPDGRILVGVRIEDRQTSSITLLADWRTLLTRRR